MLQSPDLTSFVRYDIVRYSSLLICKEGSEYEEYRYWNKLDELGRITLPIELRRNLDVNERDPLEIFVDEDTIILKKYNPADIFTGEMDDLVEYKLKCQKSSIIELAKLAGSNVAE